MRGANEWLSDWLKRGWKNARGEQVTNLDLWQQLQILLEQHTVTLAWIPRGQNTQADELARAETVTRQHQRAAVFLWQADRWLELPHGRNPAYAESASELQSIGVSSGFTIDGQF